MATPGEELDTALATLRAVEQEHATSATALEARRTRANEAERQVGELTRKLAAMDPDSGDFARLSTERQTARDRAEALRAQLGRAEGEHKGIAARLARARVAHESATRAVALARIHESSAHLSKRLRLFLAEFGPEVAAHFALVVQENEARGTRDSFTIWAQGSPDPATVGFWNMAYRAFMETLPVGSPAAARADQSAALSAHHEAMVRNSARPAGNSSPPPPPSSAGTVGTASIRG